MNFEMGKKIRLLRLGHGMTQEQLADKLCVTAQAVSKWENDVTAPDIQLLPQLSVELGVTIDELFSLTDEAKLSRIESLLMNAGESMVIPQRDFESYHSFLTEQRDIPAHSARANALLAALYNQQAAGYRAKAAEYAIAAIELEPSDKSNHSLLREAWNGADRDWYAANNSKLIAFYKRFTEQHPDNIPALQLLLDNLIADNRADEAQQVLHRLKGADNSCRVLWYTAQLCRIRGNADGMEAALEEMTEQYADDWLAWSYKGDMYARLAMYDKAKQCWLRGFELQPAPKLTDNLLCIAAASVICGDYGDAAEYYRQSIQVLKADHGVAESNMLEQLDLLARKYDDMA